MLSKRITANLFSNPIGRPFGMAELPSGSVPEVKSRAKEPTPLGPAQLDKPVNAPAEMKTPAISSILSGKPGGHVGYGK